MTGTFKRQIETGARALKPTAALAPYNTIDLLQETGTLHSDALGYDMDYFIKEQKGWVILSWQAEFERPPSWNEKVTVETWPTGGRKLIAHRNFRIVDENGIAIVRAVSQWVYFDLARRRPIRISDEMKSAYCSDIEDILPVKKNAIGTAYQECTKIGEIHLTARRSHTDSNHHVNNAVYIKWAEDCVPDDIYYNAAIKSVYVNYRKEAKRGDEISVSTYETQKNAFVHLVKNACGNEDVFAEILTKYR